MIENMEAFMINRGITEIPFSKEMDEDSFANIKEVLTLEEILANTDPQSKSELESELSSRLSQLSETESELFERMVKEIRTGNHVTVYSPSSSFGTEDYFTIIPRTPDSSSSGSDSIPSLYSDYNPNERAIQNVLDAPNFLSHGHIIGDVVGPHALDENQSELERRAQERAIRDVETSERHRNFLMLSYPHDEPAPLPS